MQVGKAGSFPAQRSWLNLRVRKIPWTCSISMYPSAPPTQDPRPQGWPSGMGKCPRNCLPVQYPHPRGQHFSLGVWLRGPFSSAQAGVWSLRNNCMGPGCRQQMSALMSLHEGSLQSLAPPFPSRWIHLATETRRSYLFSEVRWALSTETLPPSESPPSPSTCGLTRVNHRAPRPRRGRQACNPHTREQVPWAALGGHLLDSPAMDTTHLDGHGRTQMIQTRLKTTVGTTF